MGKFSGITKFDVPKYKPAPTDVSVSGRFVGSAPRGSYSSLSSGSSGSVYDEFMIPVPKSERWSFKGMQVDPSRGGSLATPRSKRGYFDPELEELEDFMLGGGPKSKEEAISSQLKGKEKAQEMFEGQEYGEMGGAEAARRKTQRQDIADEQQRFVDEAKAERERLLGEAKAKEQEAIDEQKFSVGEGKADKARLKREREAAKKQQKEEVKRQKQEVKAEQKKAKEEAKAEQKKTREEAKAQKFSYKEAAKETKATGFIPAARRKVVGFVEGAENLYQKGRKKISEKIRGAKETVSEGVDKAAEGAKKATKGKLDPEIEFVKDRLNKKVDEVEKVLEDAVPKKLWQKKTVYAGAAMIASISGAIFQGVQAAKKTNVDSSFESLATKIENFINSQDQRLKNVETLILQIQKWFNEELPKLKAEFQDALDDIEDSIALILELLGQLATGSGSSGSTQGTGDTVRGV